MPQPHRPLHVLAAEARARKCSKHQSYHHIIVIRMRRLGLWQALKQDPECPHPHSLPSHLARVRMIKRFYSMIDRSHARS